MSRRKLIPTTVLGLLTAFACMAPGAQANPSNATASCHLTPGGVDGNATIPAPPAMFTSGGFTFSGGATCSIAGVDGPAGTGPATPFAEGPLAATITASGTFNNLVCGTGTANGTATVTAGADVIDASFGITFVNGAGHLSIDVTGGKDNAGADAISGGNGHGGIDIVPTNAGGCLTSPVTSFLVNGSFSSSLSG